MKKTVWKSLEVTTAKLGFCKMLISTARNMLDETVSACPVWEYMYYVYYSQHWPDIYLISDSQPFIKKKTQRKQKTWRSQSYFTSVYWRSLDFVWHGQEQHISSSYLTCTRITTNLSIITCIWNYVCSIHKPASGLLRYYHGRNYYKEHEYFD